jgi:type II secretory pathway component GspD/PulD (secretin)
MKIHAIYALLSAAFFAVLPSQSPENTLQRGEFQAKHGSPTDRAFNSFAGDPIPLAWETSADETAANAAVDVLDDSQGVSPSGHATGPVKDDSAFDTFSGDGSGPLTQADGAKVNQSEWDIVGELTDQKERVSNQLDPSKAAALNNGETSGADGTNAKQNLASGSTTGIQSPAIETEFTDPTTSPDSSQGALPGQTGEAAPSEPQVPIEQQIVSDEEGMWIRSARLNDVLQYLARVGDFQFFHNSDLDAPNYMVTGHLRDGEPFKQMEELGMMYGVNIYQKGSTVYAMTNAQLSQLPTKPFQYNLRYLRPTDIEQIKAILQTMLTPGTGIIEYEPKTNTLLIIDNEQKVDLVKGILADMDQPKRQIVIETRILRINTNSSNKIGVDWSSVLGEGMTFEAEESLNALFGLPDSDTVSEVVTLTNSLVGGNNTSRTGASGFSIVEGASLLNGVLDGDTTGSATYNQSGEDTFERTRNESSDRNFSRTQATAATGSNLVLSPLQLSATLRALNAGGLAQQESSPTLITEDNEEGLISIIDRVPIVTSTVSETQSGTNISDEVRYRIDADDPTLSEEGAYTREIGVSIAVTPTILPDDTIRMALRPRSAQITDFVVGRSGNVFPRVNESSVDTIARIPNGSSLLIGGFYEEVEGSQENKVPILGDIPGLRFFFSSKEKTKNHTSLIFVVTPKLYEPASKPATMDMTRNLHQQHVVPSDHAWPERENPGDSYEDNLGWTIGNLVDAYDPIPPSNALNPEHPLNQPEGGSRSQREELITPRDFLEQPDPIQKPKRKGLLHHLFNRKK